MINYKNDLRILAIIEVVIALLMAIPTVMSVVLKEQEALRGFITAYVAILLFVTIAFIISRNSKETALQRRDGYLIVTLTWVIATAFSAIPLVVSGSYENFSAAFFEIMSGFTTTGATVLDEIEHLPRSILFWRSQTNWIGGMGIIVLFVALLPTLGVNATMLVNAETVGPTKDKLTPKTKNTALILWSIYLGFSVVQAALLRLGGLDLYDAMTITFSTMSTAGFSVKNGSIGSYNSAYIDVVVTLFMLLSATNFALHYKALTGRISSVLKDGELRVYLGIWSVATLLITATLTVTKAFPSLGQALRYGAFQSASIMTTTGFSTTNYQMWHPFAQRLLFLLFFVGGSAGSTSGGIKVIRIAALFKMGRAQIKSRIHPRGVFQVRVGHSTLSKELLISIATFFGVYILTGLTGSAILSLGGAGFASSLSISFLCLGNIGIGFGQVGPLGNFGFLSPALQWFCSFLMLVGRLELFTVYVLFTKHFWKR
ncbi:MAG: TrkH family potassium uptake protein [Sphaerochaeta sp.]|jgi:trk system potassium uptake protein TrkH|nr:TrkH family potassium uptake protein [Sphaerochaeta sp.]